MSYTFCTIIYWSFPLFVSLSSLFCLRKWPRGLTETFLLSLLQSESVEYREKLEACSVPQWVKSTSARRRGETRKLLETWHRQRYQLDICSLPADSCFQKRIWDGLGLSPLLLPLLRNQPVHKKSRSLRFNRQRSLFPLPVFYSSFPTMLLTSV